VLLSVWGSCSGEDQIDSEPKDTTTGDGKRNIEVIETGQAERQRGAGIEEWGNLSPQNQKGRGNQPECSCIYAHLQDQGQQNWSVMSGNLFTIEMC